MKIQINKDLLNDYKDEIWKGFTLSELLYLGIGGGCALFVVWILHEVFDMYPATAIYLAVPAAIPAVLFGFFRYQGYLKPVDFIKEILFTNKCKHLTYQQEARKAIPVFISDGLQKHKKHVRGRRQEIAKRRK